METPIMPARRSTRSALAEIPARLGALSVRDLTDILSQHQQNNLMATTTADVAAHFAPLQETSLHLMVDLQNHLNMPASYLTPTPSPDEMVIQQRGRRRLPVTWSPDIDASRHDTHRGGAGERTPPRKSHSPNRSTIVLRSTPRKRLMLSDPLSADSGSSPDKLKKSSPIAKKSRMERAHPLFTEPLDAKLKGLSQNQLIEVIQGIIRKHPELEMEVKESLPAPDLRPLEEQLNYHKRNIYKSIPTSRLTSKTDSPAYSRAAIHVLAYKKCLLEQGRRLVEAEQWDSVVEYVLLAWAYTRATPLWDNPPHNAARRACFKALAAQCMTALRRGCWEPAQARDIATRLESFVAESEDIQSCLKHCEMLCMSTPS